MPWSAVGHYNFRSPYEFDEPSEEQQCREAATCMCCSQRHDFSRFGLYGGPDEYSAAAEVHLCLIDNDGISCACEAEYAIVSEEILHRDSHLTRVIHHGDRL